MSGQLFRADGTSLAVSPVTFRVQIFDAAESCVLYSEIHPSMDLSASDGRFSLVLGGGSSRANNLDGSTGLDSAIFANTGIVPVSGCSQPTVALTAGSERQIRVSYDAGAGLIALTPDVPLVSSANALIADSVQGKTATDFIQVLDNGTTVLNQTNAQYTYSATNWPRLKALLDGNSTQYLPTTPTMPVSLNNQRVTNVSDPTAAQDVATKNYADTTLGGKGVDVSAVSLSTGDGDVLQWDTVVNKWVARPLVVTATGSAGGSLTGTYPNPTIANDVITPANIKSTGGGPNRLIITDGTSGTTFGYGVCTLNQVYAWTAMGWQCTNLSAIAPVTTVAGRTGAITLTASDIGGLGTASLYDWGTAANQIPRLDASARMPAVDGSQLTGVNAVQLQSRSISAASPTPGQVLGWNGSTWLPVASSGGSVTYVGGGTGIIGGPINSAGTLAVDVGTAPNKIVQENPSAQIAQSSGSAIAPAYSFGGNTTTGFYSPGLNQLALVTSGTNALNVTAAGAVGIGTSVPAGTLHVDSASLPVHISRRQRHAVSHVRRDVRARVVLGCQRSR